MKKKKYFIWYGNGKYKYIKAKYLGEAHKKAYNRLPKNYSCVLIREVI